MDKLISIIIPVYNISDFAKCLFFNLETQTVDKSKVELIFVDDGSTDDSFELLCKYKEDSDYSVEILNQDHALQGAARNLGIKEASGEYLYFMDSDDEIRYNDALEIMCDVLETYEPDLWIFNWTTNWHKVSRNRCEGILREINTPEERLEFFSEHRVTRSCWDKVVKHSLVNEYDLKFAERVWDEEPLYTLPAVLLAKRIYLSNDILYCYTSNRVGSSTYQLQKDNSDHVIDNVTVMMQVYEKCKALDIIEPNQTLFEDWFYVNYYVYSIAFNEKRKCKIPVLIEAGMLRNLELMFPDYKSNPLIKKRGLKHDNK